MLVDQEKTVFKRKRAVSGPSALLGPEMVKFSPNFCNCAVDQEKAVVKRKRAVSGPSALLGPEMVKFGLNFCYCKRKRPFLAHLCPFGARNDKRIQTVGRFLAKFPGGPGLQGPLPCECQQRSLREAFGGPERPSENGGWCDSVQGLGYLILRVTRQRPAGLTAQPTAACGTGSSVARRRALGSRAALPAGFSAFLDGPGSLSLGFRA